MYYQRKPTYSTKATTWLWFIVVRKEKPFVRFRRNIADYPSTVKVAPYLWLDTSTGRIPRSVAFRSLRLKRRIVTILLYLMAEKHAKDKYIVVNASLRQYWFSQGHELRRVKRKFEDREIRIKAMGLQIRDLKRELKSK